MPPLYSVQHKGERFEGVEVIGDSGPAKNYRFTKSQRKERQGNGTIKCLKRREMSKAPCGENMRKEREVCSVQRKKDVKVLHVTIGRELQVF